MSSLTAMTILPQFDCRVEAPFSPRQTSVRGVLGGELQEDHRPQVGQPLVHHHAADALDAELRLEVREEQRLVGHLLDDARLARRHLADDLGEHRLLLVGDRRHLDRHVEGFERDIAVALAERRLGLEHIAVDQALDHDLGIRRHVEVDGAAARHADRLAGRAAGDRHLVDVDRELLRPGEHHDRRRADHDGDRHLLLALAILQPMQIAAGAGRLARHHAHHRAVRRFQRHAIGAHVAHAALGVAGDAERRGEIGRGVEARRRDRHRQGLQPLASSTRRR